MLNTDAISLYYFLCSNVCCHLLEFTPVNENLLYLNWLYSVLQQSSSTYLARSQLKDLKYHLNGLLSDNLKKLSV